MGVVVEAHHELLDQRVAVKLLYRDDADREAKSRLLLEARASARLQSEHVARVIDVDVGPDGLPFIVMELLEGADLSQVADARGALPRWMVVDYVLQALEGLAHAHGRGIIHRDLKPSNLFLAKKPDGSEIIKILDFGISKSQDTSTDRHGAQLTGGRAVLGSPPYMSPEQVRRPKTVDHRTDIWSLGVCMYELLTDSMPFGGDELQETFAQVLETTPTPIRALVTGVPAGLEQIVMRCLAKDRDARFSDVAELARALVPFGSGTYSESAERVQATLARASLEDASSRRSGATVSSNRIALPGSPRRAESQQPELHGTANTVAHGFSLFERRRWGWLVALAGALAVGVVALAAVVYVRRQEAAAMPALGALEGAAPAAPVEPFDPDVARAAPTEPPSLVSPEGSLWVPPIPPAAPSATAAVPSATPSAKRGEGQGRRPPAPTPRPSKASAAAGTSKPSLPAGLPMNRSGR